MTAMRTIGDTGLETPPLVLGGNVFGWTADQATSFAILDAFVDGGGTMIDTADVYSAWAPGHRGGESEGVIGAWLKASGKRDKVLIATKVGMLPGEGGEGLAPARIAAAADASLARLGTDRIDLYYAHRPDPRQPDDAVADAFAALVEAGKVRAVGASNYSADQLASARVAASGKGVPAFGVLQPEYNLVARGSFEGSLQDYCVANGIGVLPYYGLASGFLTGKYRSKDDAAGARGGKAASYLDARGLRVLAALDAIAAETGASLAQIALAWLAAQPAVVAPIASATSVRQLDDLLGAMRLTLDDAQLAALTAAGA